MIFIRSIVFIVTLAFGFVLSHNANGILKIREGVYELTTSFADEAKAENAFVESSTKTTKYLNPQFWKYGIMIVGGFTGLFTASLVGAAGLGFFGGIIFSPEISTYPILTDYAVTISENTKSIIVGLFNKA